MEKIRNDRSLYTDVVLFFFSKTSASASSSSPHPLMLGSINPTAVLFFVTRAQRTLKRKQRAFEQATMIFTRVLNLSNVAFLANLFRFKDGFSKLQMISKTKAFPYIFLRFSSRSSLTLNSAISLFFTQIVIFSIFSSAHRLDDLPQADLSIRPVYQIWPWSDRHTRPPDQIIPPDHRPPSLTTQLPIGTVYPTSWNGTGQVHSLWVGWRGVYRALDEPCKAYFPHTFGLNFPDFFFFGLT